MNPFGILLGLTIGAGILLIIRGLTPQPVRPPKAPTRRRRGARLSRRDLIVLIGGAAAGVVIAQLTGFYIAVIVIPAALWGLPKVFSPPGQDHTALLDALASWTQDLAAMFQAGTHLIETLRASRRSAPPVLHPPLDLLLDRLDAGQDIKRALYAFADDLDLEIGDDIAGAFITAAEASTSSLGGVLADTAQLTAVEVDQQRRITTAQNAPRNEARWCLILAVLGIGGILLLPYGEFYRHGAGELFFLVLLVGFAAVLWWMRSIATVKPSPRWLVRPGTLTDPDGDPNDLPDPANLTAPTSARPGVAA